MKMKFLPSGTLLIVFVCLLTASPKLRADDVLSQIKITVQGIITDQSGNPVSGVAVVEKGTQNGTISADDGSYTIQADEDAILIFRTVGLAKKEVNVDGRTKIDVVLKGNTVKLNEVVAIGYGKQSRRKLTTAVSNVDGDILDNIPINSVGDGLKGRISGVRVYSDNFIPGGDPVIRIRGGSSINKSNAPLVLVDGIERSLSDINPNDVKSITVLKDAASTAIYGSRASNGVVLVTTKRGKLNQGPKVTFEAMFAREALETSYDFMNAKDYLSYLRPAVAVSPHPDRNNISGYSASSGNDESSIYTTHYLQPGESVPAGWKTMPDPLDNSKTLVFQDNSFKDVLYRPALWQNYYAGVTGGSDKIRYAGSMGYTNNDGVGLATSWSRFSSRANVDINVADNLRLSSNVSFSESMRVGYKNQKNVIARGLAMPPTQRIYWDDGTPTRGRNATAPNPAWYAYINDRGYRYQKSMLQETLDWDIIHNLNFKVIGSYFIRTQQHDFFEKANVFSGAREAQSGFSQRRQKKINAYFTYKKTFKHMHSLSATAGYSYMDVYYKTFSAAAQGANSDKIHTLNAAPDKTDATTNITDEALIGYFGRVNYDYKNKYLFSLSFRQDGSSRFLNGYQWGFFPGASAGWVVSEEPFLKNGNTLSFLKLRASYGQTGNNSVGLYDAQGRYSVDYIYSGNAGIRSTSMPNEGLTWESTTQLDAGVDLGFFENRMTVTVDYFDKRTQNLLFNKELPNTSGYASVESNVGKVKFYGFDVDITSTNIQNDHFSWTSSFTWSFVKNRVLALPDNGREKNRIGGTSVPGGEDFGGIAEGEPLYRFYGYKVAYLIQNEEEADHANYDENATGWSAVDQTKLKGRKFPGDYEWIDRNGDSIINSIDQFELGTTVPVSTGGLDNKFTYKNWSLDIYVDWALGHSIYDEAFQRYFMGTFNYNYALVDDVKQTWKKPGDHAKYARFVAEDFSDGNRNFTRTSDAFTYKANYLCLRDVTLNYELPKNFIRRYGIEDVNLYVSGNTLYYFTGIKGTSPEAGAASTYSNGYQNYPPIRRYSLGIKVTL